MERKLLVLLATFGVLSILGCSIGAAPVLGLVSVMGVSVLGSSVLGSSVLGSSVLASTTIVEAYSGAVQLMQPLISIILILLLVYVELTDPSYGSIKSVFVEIRKSWASVSAILLVLFLIIVGLKVWSILAA
ncbi:MAG: hypothetical protein NZ952_06655 [Candidatus Bathyarchaeota archaeon]|nr:hypothetical protein [Candidatus Bathyarchaeota archaeon]